MSTPINKQPTDVGLKNNAAPGCFIPKQCVNGVSFPVFIYGTTESELNVASLAS